MFHDRGKQHLDYLDGIRGLAAMFVVAHHFWFEAVGFNAQTGLEGLLTNWLLYGHLAVDVFIVLSGFCLTLPFADPPYKVDARTFLLRRARRILPPYFIVLAFSIVLDLTWDNWFQPSGDPPDTWITYLVNAFMLQDLLPRHNVINPPFWSVALETKIYLLFPLLVLMKRRRGLPGMLLLAAIIGYGLTASIWAIKPDSKLHASSVWFVLLFAMGMSAAFATRYRHAVAIFRAAMAVGGIASVCLLQAFPITTNGLFELYEPNLVFIDTAVGVLVAGFLLWMFCAKTVAQEAVAGALSFRPVVFIGTFAYTLYLIHWPLMEPVTYVWKLLSGHEDPRDYVGSLTVVGVMFSIAFSWLAFKLVERPFLRKRQSVLAGVHTRSAAL